ncbi:MAG: PmoA family protein [Verrucomicrobiota bacterium]
MKLTPLLTISVLLASWVQAAEFSIQTVDDGVEVSIDGALFTKYHFGEGTNKPYFWPVIGPSGKEMTRAYPMKDVEGEKQDHPHHRSFWFGHQKLNGYDTWHEKMTLEERYAKKKPDELEKRLKGLGSTVHTAVKKAESEGSSAVLVVSNDYRDNAGALMMTDVRTFQFSTDKETGARVVDATLEFTGGPEGVEIGDAKDSGFNVRVAHSMCVEAKQGGTIVNSLGDRDGDAWGKRAEWCDFNGPVDGSHVGIAILDHPSNMRHPTPWHVRGYGLFTANPFGMSSVAKLEDGTFELKADDSFALRYRVLFHDGDEKAAKVAEAYAEFSAE